MVAREHFFASCAPGLEPALHAEAGELGLLRLERQVGGVAFEGALVDGWRACLWLRSANRVLVRVARFDAPDEDALYAGAHAVPWERWLAPEGSLRVSAHARDSALFHTRYLEQRVKDAVVDRFRERVGARPDVERDSPDLPIRVQLVRDRCTLLLDLAGEPLHLRGWRKAQGRAPLSETLAAGILRLSGWDRRAPLIDPFCGSATLLVEAACWAARRAPGLERAFAFERWLGHDARALSALRDQARAERVPTPKLTLVGSELDPRQLADARENLAAAGGDARVELARADARELAPRPGWNGWIVSNLPFGVRVGAERSGGELESLHRELGARLREHCVGYHVALLGAPQLVGALGLPRLESLPILHGGLECRLVRGRIGP